MNGAEAIVKTLISEGAKHVFGFPGGSVIPLYDEFLKYDKELRHVLVRHEQCAAHAAEGYSKASGKVGVCIATSGPGATNLVTGIMDAYMDSIPIIAFAGQVPTTLIGNDAFQESDMMGITAPITKHNFQIR
ncbi:MAG: thiamine pyrophosphate-binding protein, partial [Candidatus Diapherotrites archaeon]